MGKFLEKKKNIFKILLAGHGGVGKTTLILRAISGNFEESTNITAGVSVSLLKMEAKVEDDIPPLDESNEIFLQVWDLGGQKQFRFILDTYSKGTEGALLLYDLTHLRSLKDLKEWVEIIRTHNADAEILFVGTKLDEVSNIIVKDEHTSNLIDSLNLCGHIKTSSKTGEGIMTAFKILTQKLAKKRLMEQKLAANP
jgi:small GTP-binding protein